MNDKELFKEIGNIHEDLVEEACGLKGKAKKQMVFNKFGSIVAIVAITVCTTISIFAIKESNQQVQSLKTTLKESKKEVKRLRDENSKFYIRWLSREALELSDYSGEFDSEKFFKGLNSEDIYQQYISINRLIECFNDKDLRKKAIDEIKPFLESKEKKLVEAAAFSIDILTETYNHEKVYKLADGTKVFTLFNDYSDYGSYNEIWIIKDGELRSYYALSEPLKYIKRIIPSPDGKLFAVQAISNKSEYVFVCDLEDGCTSPELVGSAKIKLATKHGYDISVRTDFENYFSFTTLYWKDDKKLQYSGKFFDDNRDIVLDAIYNSDTRCIDVK